MIYRESCSLDVPTVAFLYLALNAVFLISAPVSALRGEVEIGYVVARYLIGEQGALIVSIVLAGILISTVSAMVLAGPSRSSKDWAVIIGNSLFLGRLNDAGIPTNAICFSLRYCAGFSVDLPLSNKS